MKILALNCKPDFTYFTTRGLNLDVTYADTSLTFPLKYLYPVKDSNGQMIDMYTPDCKKYLEDNFKEKTYDIILIGWNPNDYGSQLKHTGGYACPVPLTCGSYWITVRQDNPVVMLYPVHEIMHTLVVILKKLTGNNNIGDFMDNTLVNGIWMPYYKNNDINATDGNYAQTWNQIKPFLNILNAPKYKYFSPREIVGLKPELVQLLDKMRGECGFPFKINSGYRTKAQNASLSDSVSDSAHLGGLAVDIACTDSFKRYTMVKTAIANGITRIGAGERFIHIDLSKTLPQNCFWEYN